jgi:hypothetical protein
MSYLTILTMEISNKHLPKINSQKILWSNYKLLMILIYPLTNSFRLLKIRNSWNMGNSTKKMNITINMGKIKINMLINLPRAKIKQININKHISQRACMKTKTFKSIKNRQKKFYSHVKNRPNCSKWIKFKINNS